MNHSIQAVTAGDWRRLRDLRLRALQSDPEMFGSTYARELAFPDSEWQQRAQASAAGTTARWFVAVSADDEWVGLAVAREGEAGAILNAMWLAPHARGSGIATCLCDACARWAHEHGHTELALGVYDDNPRAIAAYTKAGFVPYATEPQEGRYRTSSILMRRAL